MSLAQAKVYSGDRGWSEQTIFHIWGANRDTAPPQLGLGYEQVKPSRGAGVVDNCAVPRAARRDAALLHPL